MKTTKTNIVNFLTELKDLMRKHGVTDIGGQYDGDSHGIYDEKFFVTIKDDAKPFGKDYTINQYMGFSVDDRVKEIDISES